MRIKVKGGGDRPSETLSAIIAAISSLLQRRLSTAEEVSLYGGKLRDLFHIYDQLSVWGKGNGDGFYPDKMLILAGCVWSQGIIG